ncbi:MAG: DUF1684 domain-containing protein [Ignavibacteriaceae bacterium]
MKILFFVPLLLLTIVSCSQKPNADPEHIEEIRAWDERRTERLREEDGWLNLTGLFWFKEGENKIGSAKDNDIVFPSGPDYIGSMFLKDSSVTIIVNPAINVISNGQPVTEMTLLDDHSGNPTLLQTGSLRWNVIKRTKGFGIRLRDLNADLVKNFKGIERFPVNKDWIFEADFVPYNPPKKILVPDIIGTVDEEVCPGAVVFVKDGKEYRIDAIESGRRFFLIFADETSGEETYGAGRFMYVDKPDSNGKIILDFNKAYNPPCVFTKFATCPLPPENNFLKLRIEAGEKMWREIH